MEEVFLDTTIQIDRYYSPRKDREKIKQNLENKRTISSTYVKGEFAASLIKSAVIFYNLLSDDAYENPAEALVGLGKYSTHTSRIYNRVSKLLSNLHADLNNKEAVKYRLKMLIEGTLESDFVNGVDQIIDNTGCVRATPIISKENGLFYLDHGCSINKNPTCKINSFLEKDQKNLELIKTNGKPEKIVQKLKELEGKKTAVGRSCWGVGDTVISLEVPKDVTLYSTNDKDYAPLCAVLKKKFTNPQK